MRGSLPGRSLERRTEGRSVPQPTRPEGWRFGTAPAGFLVSCRLLHSSDEEAVVGNAHFVAVERPGRGTGEHLAVESEDRRVARADELIRVSFVVVRAAEMRTLRRERNEVLLTLAHDPGGVLLAHHFPSVHAI